VREKSVAGTSARGFGESAWPRTSGRTTKKSIPDAFKCCRQGQLRSRPAATRLRAGKWAGLLGVRRSVAQRRSAQRRANRRAAVATTLRRRVRAHPRPAFAKLRPGKQSETATVILDVANRPPSTQHGLE